MFGCKSAPRDDGGFAGVETASASQDRLRTMYSSCGDDSLARACGWAGGELLGKIRHVPEVSRVEPWHRTWAMTEL